MSSLAQDSCCLPVIACFVLSGLFVGSLYVWDSKYDRNHPSTIKKRFCSVFIVILISPFVLKFFITSTHLQKFTVLELVGFRLSGLCSAATLPLFLTMTLFLGPLCMLDITELWSSFLNPHFWWNNVTDLIWLRNIIVGPFAEELAFRACMVPLLIQCLKPFSAVFLCSFFFGLAHVHHVIESYKAGDPFAFLLIRTFVQFSYTTLFGAYSAYVFLQTGHFIAPFLIHAFCNSMGLPDFGKIFTYENPKKYIVILLFISGVILWYLLSSRVLNYALYNNYVYFGES